MRSPKNYLSGFNDKELISILNVYLENKQTNKLPKSEKLRRGVINRVKSLVIMLLRHDKRILFSRLNLPEYVKIGIDEVSNNLRGRRPKVREMSKYFGISENQYDGARSKVIRELINFLQNEDREI